MRNVFAVLGVIFLVVLIVIGGFIGFAVYSGNQLDASSKSFVDEKVPTIITNWSRDALVRDSSPRLLATTSNEQIDHFFLMLSSKLGAFKSYDGSKGDAHVNYDFPKGAITTASYVADATFQYGKVDIKIQLSREGGVWRFLGFHVDPAAAGAN